MTPAMTALRTPNLASERVLKYAQDALAAKEAATPLIGGAPVTNQQAPTETPLLGKRKNEE